MGFMLSYLRGHISEKNLDSKSFVVDVNGLGYLVQSNHKVLSQVRVSEAAEIKIYTSMQQREDGQTLYGFIDRASRDIFELLLSASGVGPKGALNILDVLEIDTLVSAVLRDKPELLAEAPGVGLKTAKRIILELNNKFKRVSKTNTTYKVGETGSLKCVSEVSGILENLGYSALEVDEKISRAIKAGLEDETEIVVRYCLAGV